jgi:hypothetical protein
VSQDWTVTVTAKSGRRQPSKIHTFQNREGRWHIMTPPSRRQIPALSRALHPSVLARGATPPPDPQRGIGNPRMGDVLDSRRIDLGARLTARGDTLAVVLDALRESHRREVDREDLKHVLSQLGSRITQLQALAPEQRRHAEPALYSEIVRRCT